MMFWRRRRPATGREWRREYAALCVSAWLGSFAPIMPNRRTKFLTVPNRSVRWRKAGVWDRILAAVTIAYDGNVQMIDSTSVRVHQHAANSKKATRIAVWATRAAV